MDLETTKSRLVKVKSVLQIRSVSWMINKHLAVYRIVIPKKSLPRAKSRSIRENVLGMKELEVLE